MLPPLSLISMPPPIAAEEVPEYCPFVSKKTPPDALQADFLQAASPLCDGRCADRFRLAITRVFQAPKSAPPPVDRRHWKVHPLGRAMHLSHVRIPRSWNR